MSEAEKLKEALRARNIRGLALDIDETLADTNNHWFDHLFKFQPIEGKSKEEIVERYKFLEHVPEWNNEKALAFMGQLMHSNDFNETIPLIENANHIVSKIAVLIPVVAYVTARPATVLPATQKWLAKHGFPTADILTRPAEVAVSLEDLAHRNVWKAETLIALYPEISAIIDDNYGLAHQLIERKYEGTLYLYGQLYGDKAEEFKDSKHVVACSTWESVLNAILASR